MKSITAFFKKIKFSSTSKKHIVVGEQLNPARDWMIGLLCAVIGLCAGIGIIAFDFYTQFGVARAIQNNVQKSISPYPTADVRRLTDEYEKREAAFTKLRNSVVREPVPVEQIASTTSQIPAVTEEEGNAAPTEPIEEVPEILFE